MRGQMVERETVGEFIRDALGLTDFENARWFERVATPEEIEEEIWLDELVAAEEAEALDECETFEDWMYYTMELETILELADHGADAGWPGLCYYNETSALYERYEKEIWEALHEDCEDGCPMALIASFNGAKNVGSDAGFRNLLVYYMAERTAHAIADSQ